MPSNRAIKSVIAIAFLLLATGLVTGHHGALAQEDESHPAHIHSGTCDQLGDVVYPLSNVSEAALVNGTPIAGAVGGAADAIPVALSGTTVDATLESLLAAPFAINIHESSENIGNYIACGNIGGAMIGSADLAIGLGELNESGYSGVATLHDNGDGTTAVSVYLTESYENMGDDMDMATPAMSDDDGMDMATPAMGGDDNQMEQSGQAATGSAVSVSIADFAYDPTPLSIAVGDTVTWTNNDAVAHTVTANDGSFQSGTLQPGDSFSFTFTAAGSFDYHCEFHANMSGQVVVS